MAHRFPACLRLSLCLPLPVSPPSWIWRSKRSCIILYVILLWFSHLHRNGERKLLGLLSQMTPSHREGPGLRGVYSYGSLPAPPTKEGGGAESPKPDTQLAQRAQNCGSQIPEASDQSCQNERITHFQNQQANVSWDSAIPAQEPLKRGCPQAPNTRILE